MKEYLESLNEPQYEGVINTEGPCMLIAGAGSGKTRVLTYRIAHLMSKGEDAFNIMALTFTNKAAKEMRERIEHVMGNDARNLWMGTFHSVFARILRAEAHHLGYPNSFSIYDFMLNCCNIADVLKSGYEAANLLNLHEKRER